MIPILLVRELRLSLAKRLANHKECIPDLAYSDIFLLLFVSMGVFLFPKLVYCCFTLHPFHEVTDGGGLLAKLCLTLQPHES